MKIRNAVLVSAVILLTGCDTTVSTSGSGSGARVLPNVSGGAGEVVVVMDNYVWEGASGELLQDILKEEFPALPQSEPLFDLTHITSASFDNLFRFHRSIVLVTINSAREEPAIRFRKDVWAKPQIVVQMEAATSEEILALLEKNREQIKNFMVQYDRKRIGDSYAENTDTEIQTMFAKNHHIRLNVPRGYNVDVSGDDYSSISIESAEFSQVLHIYEYPAESEDDMQSQKMLAHRNEFVKKYVKGPREGSYMTTSTYYPPIFYDINKDGLNIVEIRGLWELENGYMGGPFVSHSVYDSARNRIVTVEGYVYYPNQKKRIKVRQLEAIIYSLKLL